jgi:calcineurin-like phosphoesterase family protein
VEKLSRVATIDVALRDSARTWFISDPHFDHTNIIRYCDRPFETTTEMNTTIWRNWNEYIHPDDLVVFVGDMAFGRGSRKPKWWIEQLNGRMIYLKGSHDHGVRPTAQLPSTVQFVADAIIVRVMGERIYVVHEPNNIPSDWNGWAIHGHVHNNRPHFDIKKKRFNVSVEVMGYKPRSLYYFLDLMEIIDSP